MLPQFLEAVQEAFVQGAIGLRLTLELLQLGFVLAGGAGKYRGTVELGLELLLLGLGGIQFCTNRQRDALRRRIEPVLERCQFGAGLDQLGIGRTELRRHLGDLAIEIGLLVTQGTQRTVCSDFGNIRQFVGIEARLAERNETAFLLDALHLGAEVLAVEVGQGL